MCGFVGVLIASNCGSGQRVEDATALIRDCMSRLRRRGPDADGLFVNDNLVLGHTRLSIQDLSEDGNQPLVSCSGETVIAFNGEIYNFKVLRDELLQLGYKFRSKSDTEVIVNLYECFGIDFILRLRGIFSFALWNTRTNDLTLVRDRLGIKPLYVAQTQFGLAFSSEISPLACLPGVDLSLNEQAFSEYLWFGNSFENRTFYKGIRPIAPGTFVVCKKDEQLVQNYWSPDKQLRDCGFSNNLNFQAKITQTIDKIVAEQTISDVPLGLLLSGGIDSSSLAAAIGKNRIDCLAINCEFEGSINSEKIKAKATADMVGLHFESIRIGKGSLENSLFCLSEQHGEPFADAANVPLFEMCQALNSKIKVVLQGDGGDELFGGYNRHRLIKVSSVVSALANLLNNIFPEMLRKYQRLDRLADIFTANNGIRLALMMTMEQRTNSPFRILSNEYHDHLCETTSPFLAYLNAFEKFGDLGQETCIFMSDLTTQLPSQFLTKVDRASMAASVEARVPLLDERLLDLAISIPPKIRTSMFKAKRLLYLSQKERLPKMVLRGPKKGFGTPYGTWLRGSLQNTLKDRVLDRNFCEKFNLSRSTLERILEFPNHDNRSTEFLLWKLLMLAIWDQEVRIN